MSTLPNFAALFQPLRRRAGRWLAPRRAAQAEIAGAFQRTGWGNIVGAREALGEKYEYGLLRVCRAAAAKK